MDAIPKRRAVGHRVDHRNREGFFPVSVTSPAGRASSGSGVAPRRAGLGEPG
jgi:hypothetical protein